MMSHRVTSLTFLALLVCGAYGAIIPSNPYAITDMGDEGLEGRGGQDFPLRPLEGSPYRGVGQSQGQSRLGRRSYYTDSAYIPYIHPRLVMEQELPEPQQGEELLSPQNKRASRGMLVDVVDFVTKGSENRNQRTGQGMRSSGRR